MRAHRLPLRAKADSSGWTRDRRGLEPVKGETGPRGRVQATPVAARRGKPEAGYSTRARTCLRMRVYPRPPPPRTRHRPRLRAKAMDWARRDGYPRTPRAPPPPPS